MGFLRTRQLPRTHSQGLRPHVPPLHHHKVAVKRPHQDVARAGPAAAVEDNTLFSAPPGVRRMVFLGIVQATPQSISLPPLTKSGGSCSALCSRFFSSARRAAASQRKSSATGLSFPRSLSTVAGRNVGRIFTPSLSNHCPRTRDDSGPRICQGLRGQCAEADDYSGPDELDLLKQIGVPRRCLPGRG